MTDLERVLKYLKGSSKGKIDLRNADLTNKNLTDVNFTDDELLDEE